MNDTIKPAVKRIALGVVVAAAAFAGLGSVAALWDNPLFMRMTPTGGFEIALLLLLSALTGLYVGLPQAACGVRTAGTGGVIGFLGIACPVCNKILMLLFGGALLMEYYEPVRIYLALGGVALLAVAIWFKMAGRRRPSPSESVRVFRIAPSPQRGDGAGGPDHRKVLKL